MVRVGMGYDVHRLKKGRPLVLGGVSIAHPRGLDGHSDADVLIHAVMDALLGAAGMDDIGHCFPNTDARYKNISSVLLLKEVAKKLKLQKFSINNIDSTLVCEQPKIAPHIPAMKKHIAAALGIPLARVGIKATTNETMGFIGRSEGIAAMCVAALSTSK
ncbi:MAG: 2-C-methyl-D-erythritol 2,4-cyclodiphosphate synthase [Elusimicrobia bacterium]|nr:2-C-methyl-D-erythritol 2,4-cyclodiphosphate synthase [Elusimicrobiota bacterium]